MRRLRPRPLILLVAVASIALTIGCGGDEIDGAAPSTVSPTPGRGTSSADDSSSGGTTPDTTASDGSQSPGTAVPATSLEPWTARPAVEPVGETIEMTIATPDGRSRTAHLYVSTTLPTDEAVPLLVAMHGGTGWGRQFQRSSGFDGIAEANGFLVVFPDGVGVGPTDTMRTWNGGYCCGPAARDDVDDVTFISMLIDEITNRYDVDPSRIAAAGHSNGAVMSYRLACELSDQIVAVGFQAGPLALESCAPDEPVSVLHLHGADDENVPHEGGQGSRGISGVTWTPTIDGLRTIAAAIGCPDESRLDSTDPILRIEVWSPCDDGTVVEYVLVAGANHAWMGATGGPLSPSGPPFADFDSSAAIWSFLARHPRG